MRSNFSAVARQIASSSKTALLISENGSTKFHEAYFGLAICKALRAGWNRKIRRPIFTVCAGIHRFQQIGFVSERKTDSPICRKRQLLEVVQRVESRGVRPRQARYLSFFC